MKVYIRYFLVLLLCAGFNNFAGAQQIKADASLDSARIKIGGQTRLHLSIRFKAKDSVKFPVLADSIGKIQIISNKADTSFDKNDITNETISHNYLITSFDSGRYVIPSYTITTKNGSYKTDSLTLTVAGVAVDTTKAIYDIKQPLTVSYTFLDWLRDNWAWVVIALVVLLAIAGTIYYYKKLRKPKPVAEEVKVIIPPHITALKKLDELRSKKLWQQEMVKEYYIELTDIIREYLEKRYNIQALEQTTDEILTSLRYASIPADDRKKLKQLLVLADLVKFAKEKPMPAENEYSMDNAVGFITNTQQAAMPENKEENKGHA